MLHTLSSDLRKALLLLAFAPFVLLQGVAPGTMVQAGPAGPQMVLCLTDDDADGTPADRPHDGHAPLCAWSVLSVSGLTSDPIPLMIDPSAQQLGYGYSPAVLSNSAAMLRARQRAPPRLL